MCAASTQLSVQFVLHMPLSALSMILTWPKIKIKRIHTLFQSHQLIDIEATNMNGY